MRHSAIQELLYEYLHEHLNPLQRKEVDDHLLACADCRAEMEELRDLLGQFSPSSVNPSATRTDEYWAGFARQVEAKIAEDEQVRLPERRRPFSFQSMIEHMIFAPRPYIAVFGGAMAVVVCALFVWRWVDRSPRTPEQMQVVEQASGLPIMRAADDSTNERLHQYISRSKMLLVGISNMKPVNASSYDLSVERAKSKELITEARYLKGRPIDARAQRLIGDLERILIELANMKEEGNAPNVEILRGGLHQENLLFKIRMEERTFASPRDSVVL